MPSLLPDSHDKRATISVVRDEIRLWWASQWEIALVTRQLAEARDRRNRGDLSASGVKSFLMWHFARDSYQIFILPRFMPIYDICSLISLPVKWLYPRQLTTEWWWLDETWDVTIGTRPHMVTWLALPLAYLSFTPGIHRLKSNTHCFVAKEKRKNSSRLGLKSSHCHRDANNTILNGCQTVISWLRPAWPHAILQSYQSSRTAIKSSFRTPPSEKAGQRNAPADLVV